jgi:hypothetical protein
MHTQTRVYELVTGPASEPVTLAEAKEHCRVDIVTDDAYITALITAARELVSQLTGRALITETWSLTLDDWPNNKDDDWWDGQRDGALSLLDAAELEIQRAPFLAVTSVKTIDAAAAETVWSASNYYVAKRHGFGRLIRQAGVSWPIPGRDRAGIVITFTIGYGASASAVPAALRQAIKMLVQHWYDNRAPASECASGALMPMGLGAVLQSYKVFR